LAAPSRMRPCFVQQEHCNPGETGQSTIEFRIPRCAVVCLQRQRLNERRNVRPCPQGGSRLLCLRCSGCNLQLDPELASHMPRPIMSSPSTCSQNVSKLFHIFDTLR
jgi:hypothetical protein